MKSQQNWVWPLFWKEKPTKKKKKSHQKKHKKAKQNQNPNKKPTCCMILEKSI